MLGRVRRVHASGKQEVEERKYDIRGRLGCKRNGVSYRERLARGGRRAGAARWSESWWAIITFKVIKDIGRQRSMDGGGTPDIYIVIKSREQVGPLGEIPAHEPLQTH